MKTELDNLFSISLIPENIQDKIWLVAFAKELEENEVDCNSELSFHSEKGGGYADPKKVGVYDEEDGKIDIDFEDIEALTFYSHSL